MENHFLLFKTFLWIFFISFSRFHGIIWQGAPRKNGNSCEKFYNVYHFEVQLVNRARWWMKNKYFLQSAIIFHAFQILIAFLASIWKWNASRWVFVWVIFLPLQYSLQWAAWRIKEEINETNRRKIVSRSAEKEKNFSNKIFITRSLNEK